MTAVTLTTQLEVNDPTKEVVIVTASDDYTYTSKKFGKVIAVQGTFDEDQATLTYPLSLAISSATVTVHCTGLSSKKICLTLYGAK